MIYMDHAATSWPKPPQVIRAMVDYLERAGGNPGRSGHRLSIAAGRIVYETREALAAFFNAPDPMRVILTPNVTYALNIALLGLLRPGDQVVTSSMEHKGAPSLPNVLGVVQNHSLHRAELGGAGGGV